jgi:hypothetical protein
MNIYVIGERGQGKSTLALFLARRIQKAKSAHVIPIFDPKRTYNSIPHTADLDILNDWLETPPADAVAYQPFTHTAGDNKNADEVFDAFTEFFDTLGVDYHLGLRDNASRPDLSPVVLVVDEAWFLQSGASAHPRLESLVRLADSKRFFLIQAAHRPKDFSTRIRAQLDELYIFHQWAEEDLEIISQWCGEEVAEAVKNLPPHHVVKFMASTRTWEVWTHPEGWYFSLEERQDVNATDSDGETETGTARSSRSA